MLQLVAGLLLRLVTGGLVVVTAAAGTCAAPRITTEDLYFSLYGSAQTQEMMLRDERRMRAFETALAGGACRDKVVLDLGAGTGVLSVFAARGGARRVYAVEGSLAAVRVARHLVAAANQSAVVRVLHAVAEDVALPEQVDLIVAEWMGYLLFEEGMVDSVLRARDKWLKPGGSMIPAHARLWAALAAPGLPVPPGDEQDARMSGAVVADMWRKYGLDFALPPSPREGRVRWINAELGAGGVCGHPVELAQFDMLRLRLADVRDLRTSGRLGPGCDGAPAVAVWFDVALSVGVNLSTAPGTDSHWRQTLFWLPRPLQEGPSGGSIAVRLRRHPEWWRHHDVRVQLPGIARDYPVPTSLWWLMHGQYHPVPYMYR